VWCLTVVLIRIESKYVLGTKINNVRYQRLRGDLIMWIKYVTHGAVFPAIVSLSFWCSSVFCLFVYLLKCCFQLRYGHYRGVSSFGVTPSIVFLFSFLFIARVTYRVTIRGRIEKKNTLSEKSEKCISRCRRSLLINQYELPNRLYYIRTRVIVRADRCSFLNTPSGKNIRYIRRTEKK
jgi:hypothetical protein